MVAVRAGVLTSHRFQIITACVTSTREHGVASAGIIADEGFTRAEEINVFCEHTHF